MQKTEAVKIIVVDDHNLFRKGIVGLISNFENFNVVYEASNGEELIRYLTPSNCPDIIILDINMPIMDGYETAVIVRKKFPKVKILALSMNDAEETVIKMIKAGTNGYILKDAEPDELKMALLELMRKGFCHTEIVSDALVKSMNSENSILSKNNDVVTLNNREIEFIQHACTELTYKEIADLMYVTPRAVDGYRESVFEKLGVKNRVGLVLYAIKNRKIKVF